MAHWGRSIEFSKGETKALLDACTIALIRQLNHRVFDPELTNVVKKAAQCLHKFNENECPFEGDT